MPDDVLEQFVFGHGLNPAFQEQYGDLDLHRLHWTQEDLPAAQLIQASGYPGFTRHPAIAALLQETAREQWSSVLRDPKALATWEKQGTWLRPPVMLEGGLVGREAALHRSKATRGLARWGRPEVFRPKTPSDPWEALELTGCRGRWRPRLGAARTGSQRAIIGSSNFTPGGHGANAELNTVIEGDPQWAQSYDGPGRLRSIRRSNPRASS